MLISLIAAVAKNGVIGFQNRLPWNLPADMKYFKEKTVGHVIITGRKNYESIPQKFRPLPGRTNIIITRNPFYDAAGAIAVRSLQEALEAARHSGETECFVIGGAEIFRLAMPFANRLYITRIDVPFEGDTFFEWPDLDGWKETMRQDHEADEKNPYPFSFTLLEKNVADQ